MGKETTKKFKKKAYSIEEVTIEFIGKNGKKIRFVADGIVLIKKQEK
ncbi:hypothetical protein LJB88_00050 [Erysipelotrichaceae bacterium OttesenSCG-928-M19]|nr:hypothetical protein [Erysipelotrichaceae bacterium OttesenSCG-928-M19]